MISRARLRDGSLLAAAMTIAAVVVSEVSSPTWVRIVVGVLFLIVVPGLAALALGRAILGAEAGPDLQFAVAAVILFMTVIAAGAVYLGLDTRLRPLGLVIAIAVLAVAMHAVAYALRRSNAGGAAPQAARAPRPTRGQAVWSVLAVALAGGAVAIAVTSTQSADASHEFTALGIHPDVGRALPGFTKYSVNVISHETASTRFVLRITVGSRTELRHLRLSAGASVTEQVEAPATSIVYCTLAFASEPSHVYRSVRFVPKGAKPLASLSPSASASP